jgi:hypothetical protein
MSSVFERSRMTESRAPQRTGEREAVGDDDVVSLGVDEAVVVVEREFADEALLECEVLVDDDSVQGERVSMKVTVRVDDTDACVPEFCGDVDKVGVGASCVSDAVSVDGGLLEQVVVGSSSELVRVTVTGRSALAVAGCAVRTTEID